MADIKKEETIEKQDKVEVKDVPAEKAEAVEIKSDDVIRKQIEAEIKAETQKEIDRRVSEALKKRERQLKAEAEEKERLAKLSEEEKIAELKATAEREQKAREILLNSRELKLSLIDYLSEKNVDLALKDIINIDSIAELEDSELRLNTLKGNVDKVVKLFNKAVDDKVNKVKEELLKGQSPIIATTNNLTEYERATKNNDVMSMLAAKFK